MDTQQHPVSPDAKDEHTATITNYQKFEEIYIKEEPLETTSQDCEFYQNVLETVKKDEVITDNDEESDKDYPVTVNNNIRRSENTKKRFFCAICNKSFKQKTELRRHVKIHSGIKEYQCDKCEKTFRRKDHLKVHVEGHYEIRKFPCPICNKSFPQNSSLTKHMKFHSNSKEFQCSLCEKSFKLKFHLNRHVKAHSGIKDFKCVICNKLYTQSGYHYHMKIHSASRNRDYHCTECEKSFRLKHHLQRHITRIHSRKNT